MRLWMVDPRKMCLQHLLGEHSESHAFRGAMERGYSLRGYLEKGLIEPGRLKERHDALVAEFERRGLQHRTPMVFEPDWEVHLRKTKCEDLRDAKVDVEKSRRTLITRCKACVKLLCD